MSAYDMQNLVSAMPSTVEKSDRDLDSLNTTLQESFQSWRNNLPVCGKSETGFARNQTYLPLRVGAMEFYDIEDRSFQYSFEGISFYGVFDGHRGPRAADFLYDRLPQEILLGQLKDKTSDSEIKDLLREAFLTLETTFFQTMDNLLAEKEVLTFQLYHGNRPHQKEDIKTAERLNEVNNKLYSGTAAVVALVIQNRLFVASVGDCRAILCKENDMGQLETQQLINDHNFENQNEVTRLLQLGVTKENLDYQSKNSRFELSRCIGNYFLKAGRKEFKTFRDSTEEPILAEPEVVGGIPLESNFKYLILMSGGLHKNLDEAIGTSDANALIAQMVDVQLLQNKNLKDSVQSVVDEVVKMHFDAHMAFMPQQRKSDLRLRKRLDMTLLVRQFDEYILTAEQSYYNNATDLVDSTLEPTDNITEQSHDEMKNDSSNCILSYDSTSSESGYALPYVDFTDFYAAINEAHKNGDVPDEWIEE